MSTVTKPIALDESFNTTGQTPKNIADVIKNGLQEVAQAIDSHQGGGGHVILDQNGNALDQEPNMQFVDAHTSDDSVNTKTIIENIKSVTEAQFESATEDGLYDVDVEGAEIGEISEEYVEVTADGTKTWETILNDIYSKIDQDKLNVNGYIETSNSNGKVKYSIYRITSNTIFFTYTKTDATYLYSETIEARTSGSKFYTYYQGSGNDWSSQPVASGYMRFYYGNDKAVVDLQTTANRCLMSDGETTVEDRLNDISMTLLKSSEGYTKDVETTITLLDNVSNYKLLTFLFAYDANIFWEWTIPTHILIAKVSGGTKKIRNYAIINPTYAGYAELKYISDTTIKFTNTAYNGYIEVYGMK